MTALDVAETDRRTPYPAAVDGLLRDVSAVIRHIQAATDPGTLQDASAAVQAARAWAKAQKRLEEVRSELFRIEAEALARIAQLGQESMLSYGARRAASFLATLTSEDRQAWCAEWEESASTVRASYECYTYERTAELQRQRGREYPKAPRRPDAEPGSDEAHLSAAPSQIINEIINGYVATGDPFTVDDVAEAMLSNVTPPRNMYEEEWRDGVREGVREMVRFALRNGECVIDSDLEIPKTITTLTYEGHRDYHWVRIPTQNATVGDVLTNLKMRDQQIEDLIKARDRFKAFADWAAAAADGDETAVIGDLIGGLPCDRKQVAA